MIREATATAGASTAARAAEGDTMTDLSAEQHGMATMAGHDMTLYHGTAGDIGGALRASDEDEAGVLWTALEPDLASAYAWRDEERRDGGQPRVIQLRVAATATVVEDRCRRWWDAEIGDWAYESNRAVLQRHPSADIVIIEGVGIETIEDEMAEEETHVCVRNMGVITVVGSSAA